MSATSGTVGFAVSGVPIWFTPSITSGTVGVAPLTITFTVNENANNFTPGTYPSTLTFTNTTNNQGTQARVVSVVVTPLVVPTLVVGPSTNGSALGTQGGPFSQNSFQYSLSATTGSVDYNVIVYNGGWLDVSSSSGTVGGTPSAITFSLNAAAANLAPGSYNATILFENGTDTGPGSQTRLLTLVVNASGTGPFLQGLGDLGFNHSLGLGVSADGKVAVGESFDANGALQGFQWVNGVMTALSPLAGQTQGEAFAANSDGSHIGGDSLNPTQAVEWTNGNVASAGSIPNYDSFSPVRGVNADGAIVVGSTGNGTGIAQAFSSSNGVMTGLGFLNGYNQSTARAVSYDGSVIAGYAGNNGFFPGEAIVWTNGALSGLGFLGSDVNSWAFGISGDGKVVVGASNDNVNDQAFRWTSAGGMKGLGFLSGATSSDATATNSDGSVVVGSSNDAAFRWTQADGMQRISDLLNAAGVDASGWALQQANGVSADGTIIVGTGTNPSGHTEGWIARVPLPIPTSTLTVTTSAGGAVTSSPAAINCGSLCNASFVNGSQVTLTATPTVGWSFAGWAGACNGVSPCPLTINGPTNVSASFTQDMYTLSVAPNGGGVVASLDSGINCGASCSANYASGSLVHLNATPSSGWMFAGWSGASCSGTGPCLVTMNNPTSVLATFQRLVTATGNTWNYTCSDTSFDDFAGVLAGTTPWTSASSADAIANANKGKPAPGDAIRITNICLGDATIAVPNLIVTNHLDSNPAGASPPNNAADFPDGFDGQVEITGAPGVVLRNLVLKAPTSGFAFGTSNFSGAEIANVYLHDGAVLSLQNSWVGSGPLHGMAIEGAGSSARIGNSTISGNGTAGTANANDGIRAAHGGSLTLGASDGGQGVVVANNAGNGIALLDKASANINASSIQANSSSQIYSSAGSSLRLHGVSVSQAGSSGLPAIAALNGSSLWLEALQATRSSVTAGTAGGVLVAGASSAIFNATDFSSISTQQPTIEAGSNSTLILAGGNSISNSSAGGVAFQVDHSSSLLQQKSTALGYSNNAPETISGSGLFQVQSSADIGIGPISNNPSVNWSVPSGDCILIQQNSSFRMSGGAAIAGAPAAPCALNGGQVSTTIVVQQESNAFFNLGHGGTNVISGGGGVSCVFAGMANAHDTGKATITPTGAQPAIIGSWSQAGSFISPGCLGP